MDFLRRLVEWKRLSLRRQFRMLRRAVLDDGLLTKLDKAEPIITVQDAEMTCAWGHQNNLPCWWIMSRILGGYANIYINIVCICKLLFEEQQEGQGEMNRGLSFLPQGLVHLYLVMYKGEVCNVQLVWINE